MTISRSGTRRDRRSASATSAPSTAENGPHDQRRAASQRRRRGSSRSEDTPPTSHAPRGARADPEDEEEEAVTVMVRPNVALNVQLLVMPAQGWARRNITTRDIDPLRRQIARKIFRRVTEPVAEAAARSAGPFAEDRPTEGRLRPGSAETRASLCGWCPTTRRAAPSSPRGGRSHRPDRRGRCTRRVLVAGSRPGTRGAARSAGGQPGSQRSHFRALSCETPHLASFDRTRPPAAGAR